MVSLLFCISAQLSAEPLTQSQWNTLQHSLAEPLSQFRWQQSAQDIDRQITRLAPDYPIPLTYFVIKQLSEYSQLSDGQKQWLEGLTQTEQRLYLHNPDHPRSPILLTDIARQAKAALQTVEINAWQVTLEQQWQRNRVQWQAFIAPDTPAFQGLVNWLGELNGAELSRVSGPLLQHLNLPELPDNRLLYLLLAKGPQLSTLEVLWQRPVDRYTHKVLQALSQWHDPVVALAQLRIGLSKPELQSQVLMTLARDFSDQAEAQQMLRQSLQNPKMQWMTVALLPRLKDKDFRSQLAHEFAKSSTALGKVVLSQLQQEVER